MKTIRSMFLAVFTFLSSITIFKNKRKAVPTLVQQNDIAFENARTQELKVQSMLEIYKEQCDLMDNTLLQISHIPRKNLTASICSNRETIKIIRDRIDKNLVVNPNYIIDAVEFCTSMHNRLERQ